MFDGVIRVFQTFSGPIYIYFESTTIMQFFNDNLHKPSEYIIIDCDRKVRQFRNLRTAERPMHKHVPVREKEVRRGTPATPPLRRST